jgi:transposase
MNYCGVDIAKKKQDAVFLDKDGKSLGKPMTFSNTASGFEEFISRLQSLDQDVMIGLEATGIVRKAHQC